jgi:predicted lipoprotein with Yx(FWY)xxD motif
MSAQPRRSGFRLRRSAVVLATTAAFLGAFVMAGIAVAKSMTLSVAKNAKVTDMSTSTTKLQNIAVNSRGFAVYTLSGETTNHVKCKKSNGCLAFWFPVTASSKQSLAKDKSIKGHLGLWHRGSTKQVTLNNDPLYTFKLDTSKRAATGQNITSFGGTWHVVTASGGSSSGGSSGSPPPMSPTPSPPIPGY